MTLIERYLHAVRGFLPASGQDDIIRELSEEIHSQVAEREETLGRPLTESDQSALLKQFGHPMLLAAKYRPQRHLIGAPLFPFYWFALKMALGAALIVHLAIGLAMIVAGQAADGVIGRLVTFPVKSGVTVFGWVTLVFAVIDVGLPRIRGIDAWDPRTLSEPRPDAEPSRVRLLCEIMASTGFLAWWLAVPRFPFLIFGPAASFLSLTPAFQSVHLPIAALWLASLAALWAVLLRPGWTRFRVGARLITNGLGLVSALMLLRAGTLVMLADRAAAPEDLSGVVRALNTAAPLGLAAWAFGCVWELLRTTWRSWRTDVIPRP